MSIQNTYNFRAMRKNITRQITIGVIYFLNQKAIFRFFADLRNYAFFKSELAQDAYERREQFDISLDTIISMIERSVAAEISEKK